MNEWKANSKLFIKTWKVRCNYKFPQVFTGAKIDSFEVCKPLVSKPKLTTLDKQQESREICHKKQHAILDPSDSQNISASIYLQLLT